MGQENWEQICSFLIFAAKYVSVLCAFVWLCSTIFELIKTSSRKRSGFYKGVFWVIYLAFASVGGLFLKAINIDDGKKITILMVVLFVILVFANLLCRYFEITARKAATRLQNIGVKVKNGRF